MDADLVFIVTYECPSCRVSLEDRSSGSPVWQRCPNCSRASLPPEHQRFQRTTPVKESATTLEIGHFVIGPGAGKLPIQPRAMAPLPSSYGPKTSHLRVVFGAGFFASLILAVFSLLESNTTMGGLFGFVSVVCLILLFVPTSRPSGD